MINYSFMRVLQDAFSFNILVNILDCLNFGRISRRYIQTFDITICKVYYTFISRILYLRSCERFGLIIPMEFNFKIVILFNVRRKQLEARILRQFSNSFIRNLIPYVVPFAICCQVFKLNLVTLILFKVRRKLLEARILRQLSNSFIRNLIIYVVPFAICCQVLKLNLITLKQLEYFRVQKGVVFDLEGDVYHDQCVEGIVIVYVMQDQVQIWLLSLGAITFVGSSRQVRNALVSREFVKAKRSVYFFPFFIFFCIF
eukprot:TRINITY_DN3342_c0_g1_i11.p2 TRINITY_DN3342_c0_g1~~TRINITY_DN3342_c0_g1_i11.p2  ORF type:complete len:257 (-),score=-8.60 TRINITY_DN3342_c0_g1_i11:1163-1933(-)